MNLKSALILGLGRVLQLAIVFVTFRFLTNLLPVHEVGFFFLLQALSGFVILTAISPIGSFVTREINNWQSNGSLHDGLLGFASLTITIALMASLLFGLAHFAGFSGWSNYAPLVPFTFGLFVTVSGAAIANTYIPLFNILGCSQIFVLISVISQSAAFAASVSLAYYQPMFANAVSWMTATGLIQLAFGFVAYRLLSRKNSPRTSEPDPANSVIQKIRIIFEKAPSFSGPLMVANLAVWCLIQGYRPMIESLKGLEFLAYVGLGMGLASSISAAFEALLHQIFMPKFYRSLDDRSAPSYAKSWNSFWQNVFPVYIGFTIVLVGLSKQFISVLANETYASAWIYFSIGAIAEFFRMAGNVIVFYTQGERKTQTTLAPYWAGALVALGGSAYSALINQLEGVAASVVLGQMIATGWMIVNVSKSSKRMVSFRISLFSIIRFIFVPATLVYAARDLPAAWSIGVIAAAMTALTGHYWWVRARESVHPEEAVP